MSSDKIIKSFNLFLDSHNVRNNDKGDDIVYSLARNPINASDGQVIKISLQNFNMYRNFYTINANNNKLNIHNTSTNANIVLSLDSKNYITIRQVAINLKDKFLAALSLTESSSTVLPAATDSMDATSDRIITITAVVSTSHGFTAGDLLLQSYQDNDSAELLGGKKILSAYQSDTTNSSYTISYPNATTIKIVGFYPAQRSTEEYVYLRTDLPNSNLESASLSAAKSDHSAHIVNSNILARLPMGFEFIHYDANYPDEYFIETQSKHISEIRLQLRDSKDRSLPTIDSTQNTNIGNIKFTCVLKVEVIQKFIPNNLETQHPVSTIPGTKLSGTNYVMDRFSKF